jgi:hypothetical protein
LHTKHKPQKEHPKVTPSYNHAARKPKRKIQEEFSLKRATALGGFNLLADFMDSIGFAEIVSRHLEMEKADWATYSLASMVEMMVQGYACGLQRPFHFDFIQKDPLVTHKLGLEALPDHTLFNKDLKRFGSEEAVRQLQRVHWEVTLGGLQRRKRLILDFDSTVETVYGNQENAAVGYNPHKHGRASYHPLLAYEGASGLSLNASLRPGNTCAVTDAVAFIQETLAMYPAQERIARFDKGFDSNEVMEMLEEEGCHYVIKMRGVAALGAAILDIPRKKWKAISDEEGEAEITVFSYQAAGWTRARRVVVVRRKTDEGSQRSFWDRWGYSYSAYGTDLAWASLDVYQFYNHRGNAENLIKESKYGFGIDQIPTGEFYPNWANLLLKLMAYNTLLLLQKALVPKGSARLTAITFRRMFVTLPAQLVHRSGRWFLKLPEWFPLQKVWWSAREGIAPA